MGFSASARNQALNGLDASGSPTNLIAYVNLNTADPGTTGASEATGGGNARVACSWNAASSGSKTNSSSLTVLTGGTTACTYFSAFSASTAGTFGGGGALTSSVTATSITIAAGALSFGA